ncbi:MAG TPA: response regulator, partial [Pyrinomonadaceae bacterium]
MSAPAETPEQNSTLLIVANDDSGHERLKSIFEDGGYRTRTAKDAVSTLRVLQEDVCDLVVLDLEIAGVDSLALCRLLRSQSLTSKIPVVALSGKDDEQQKVETFAAGADDYITKPSTPGELISRIGSHLRAAQRQWALIG